MKKHYGVKLYDRRFCNAADLDLMEECGLNTVFLGRGALDVSFSRELTRRGFFWNIVEPVFLLEPDDPRALATLKDGKPAESDWVRFACPTDSDRIEAVRARIAEDIRSYDPPGVSLDFIRFFQYWETTDPRTPAHRLPQSCFCPRCMEMQKAFRSLPEWRRHVISSTAKYLCESAGSLKPSLRIGIHCVPWTQDMFGGAVCDVVGQDFHELSEIGDYLTPMIYHHMMRLSPDYVQLFMKDMESQGCSCILPSVQVKEAYREDKMGPQEFGRALELALQGNSDGVVLYKWEDLAADSVKLGILRSTLSEAGLRS